MPKALEQTFLRFGSDTNLRKTLNVDFLPTSSLGKAILAEQGIVVPTRLI